MDESKANNELLNDKLLSQAMKYYNNGKKLYNSNDKTKAIKLFEHSLNAIKEFKKLKPDA